MPGVDLEINMSDKVTQKKDFINSGQIDHYQKINVPVESFRYALNVGAGYDIYIADINQKVRSQFSPYFSFQIGSKEISAYNSNRIPFVVKLGVSVKFEVDDIKYDTLFFNPLYIEEPKTLATMRSEKGIEFELSNEHGQVNTLEARELPIAQELSTEKIIKAEEKVKIEPIEVPPTKETLVESEPTPKQDEEVLSKVKLELKKPKVFIYGSSSSFTLNSGNEILFGCNGKLSKKESQNYMYYYRTFR